MNFSFHIAKRYLFSKNSNNAINIISIIAAIGVFGGSMALLLVLSVFSGLKSFSSTFLKATDPDVRIEALQGKSFFYNDSLTKLIEEIPEIISHSKTIEEKAYFKNRERELIAYVKGVDSNYTQVTKIDSLVYRGNWLNFDRQTAVVGNGIGHKLALGVIDYGDPFQVYVPRPGKYAPQLSKSFNWINVQTQGVFSISEELDEKYAFIPLKLCQNLLKYKNNQIGAIDLKTVQGKSDLVRSKLKKRIGDAFKIRTRGELNAVFYKILNTEKLIAYLIFTLVLVLAIFNVIGSMIMMILDKKNNLKTLYNLGASISEIRRIFVIQGFLMSLVGLILGTVMGTVLILLQNEFQWFMITETIAYPIELRGSNLLIVWATIGLLGIGGAKISSTRITKSLLA